MNTDDLTAQLKQQITEALNLQAARWDGVTPSSPLIGEGLGLDSIDALELIVLVEREYGVRITDSQVGRRVFESLDALAQFISRSQAECGSP